MAGRAATSRVIRGRHAISVNDPGHPIPRGWQRVALDDVADLGTGHTPSRHRPEYWDGGVPWIGIRDAGAHHGRVIANTVQTVSDLGLANSAARLLPKDTVCLSRTASVGYVVKMGREMATSQDFVTWSCLEPLDADYLMNALLAEGQDIRRFGEGSTHTTIYFPEVKAFHIDLPPKPEQRRIVAKLGRLTGRLARARVELDRASSLPIRMRQAVLAEVFGGKIEQHWGTMKDVGLSIEAGKNIKCEERRPLFNEAGLVKVSAVSAEFFRPEESKTLPNNYSASDRDRIHPGDLLLARASGSLRLVGRVAIVKQSAENLFLSDKVLRLRLPPEIVDWVHWFMRSPVGRSQIEDAASGISMHNITQGSLMGLRLPMPDEKSRSTALLMINSAFARADRLEAEAARARALLDRLESAILAKAFRGELVPQDPNDEPASVLLDRIRAERAAAPKPKRGRRAAADA